MTRILLGVDSGFGRGILLEFLTRAGAHAVGVVECGYCCLVIMQTASMEDY